MRYSGLFEVFLKDQPENKKAHLVDRPF